MARNETTYLVTRPNGDTVQAVFKWTVSRGRDTYGYNICTLRINGDKVAACNGGGYDMEGTCLGDWLTADARDLLLKLTDTFYGLTFHDPDFDPGKAMLPDGRTVAQAEKDGDSLGLDRYQQHYAASSRTPTERHTVPAIDGGCGMSSVQGIAKAVGYAFQYIQ